ncbi:PaaI family thioesterase [Nioella sp.]|jgi:uncharacterized protein (TIGR00369 family)|uniref:PaaI family thioesterase n=1 Tax=Nioella sp. TaxID=1912091 RepID=UPI00351425D1
MALAMDKSALAEFLDAEFPQVAHEFTVEHVEEMAIRVRLNVGEQHLRPGGTVSGPSMFALADVSIYLATLAMIGPKALSVTTNIAMDFMRKPAAATDLICEARLLKLGRSLAVGDCLLYSDGGSEPVARASMTYAIPPAR